MVFPLLSQNILLFLRGLPLLLCCAVNLLVEDVDVIGATARRRHGDVGVTAGWMRVCKIEQNNNGDVYPGDTGLGVLSSPLNVVFNADDQEETDL